MPDLLDVAPSRVFVVEAITSHGHGRRLNGTVFDCYYSVTLLVKTNLAIWPSQRGIAGGGDASLERILGEISLSTSVMPTSSMMTICALSALIFGSQETGSWDVAKLLLQYFN